MACPAFSNFAFSTLAANITAAATSLTVEDSQNFPVLDVDHTYFYAMIVDRASWDANQDPPSHFEYVKVTNRDTNTWTIERAADLQNPGAVARDWCACDIVVHTVNAQALLDIEECSGGGGGGDPFIQAQYVTMALNSGLTSERVLTAGDNITITDNGANGTVVIAATTGGGAGTLKFTVFNADGTFTPDAGVEAVWLDMYAGGGSGAGGSTTAGGPGGGSGEYCEGKMYPVSGPVAVVVGAGGAASAANSAGTAGVDGGDTSFDTLTVKGGKGGVFSSNAGGSGGGVNGGAGAIAGVGVIGSAETPSFYGGSSGGARGLRGGGSGGFLTGGLPGGSGSGDGGGGGSTPLHIGAAGSTSSTDGVDGTANTGVGGGGGSSKASTGTQGGDGGSGKVIVYWIGT